MQLLRRFPGFLLIFAQLLVSAPSRAVPSPAPPPTPEIGAARKVRLEYTLAAGAEKCPSADVLAHAIRSRLDHDPFLPTAQSLLRVTIGRAGQAFQASYELIDETGKVLFSKTLEDKPCSIVTGEIAFSISVIMPPLLTAPVVSSPPPASPPAPAPSPARAAAPSPAAPGPSAAPASGAAPSFADAEDQIYFTAHKVRPRVSLAVLGAFGLLPSPFAYGPQVGIGAQWRRFSLSLESRALFSTPVELGKDRTAFTALVLAMLTPCAHTEIARPLYSLDFCAWLGAGRMVFEPNNDISKPFIRSDQVHPFTIMVGVRPVVTWQFSPKHNPDFFLKPFTELDVSVVAHRITFNGDTIWDKVPWGLVIGVEVSALVGQPPKWDKPLAKDPEVARGY